MPRLDEEVVEGIEGQQAQEDAAMEAAFAAVDGASPAPVIAEPVKEEAKIEDKPVEAAPEMVPPVNSLSEDQLKLLAAIPELERRLTQQADKVAGNYGELKRVLDSMQKASATPQGAASFEASEDSDYLDREFPDLSPAVQAKIDKSLAKMPGGLTPEQLDNWYANRKAAEYQALVTILDTAHPDRIEIRESPEWKEWLSTLPPYEEASTMNSDDPYYVSGQLSKFKEYRNNKTSAAVKSKQRLENAITPQGVPPTGRSTISEDEAAQKAFDAQFT